MRFSNFLVISLLLGFVSACSPFSDFTVVEEGHHGSASFRPIIPPGKKEALVYDAKVEAYDKSLSGLMIIRSLDSRRYRVVLTAKMGPTFLDMEVGSEDRKVHHVMDALDRNIILDKLELDLRLLFMTRVGEDAQRTIRENKAGDRIHTFPKGKGEFHYSVRGQEVGKGWFTRWGRKKILQEYDSYKKGIPRKIRIEHLNKPIELALSYLES